MSPGPAFRAAGTIRATGDGLSEKGLLFVVAAPSGAGKTSLCKALIKRLAREGSKELAWSVSYTTRPRREGERDGRDYFFVDDETFDRMIENREFAEWANVHGKRYGTSRAYLEKSAREGVDLLVEIDIQGARTLQESVDDGAFIFILPPSWDALKTRLVGRGTEKEDEIERRLSRAREEILEWERFNYIIINDDFDQAVETLKCVVASRRAGRDHMAEKAKGVLPDFTAPGKRARGPGKIS